MTIEFQPWPKIARLNREMIVTEKIDGSNAAVIVVEDHDWPSLDSDDHLARNNPEGGTVWGEGIVVRHDGRAWFVAAQSRKRILSPGKSTDNFGFAAWVREHAEELARGLGHGRHFGEWYGKGIQRSYGLVERRFALFNVSRWSNETPPPGCCEAVPTLYRGPFEQRVIDNWVNRLRIHGSQAAPGWDPAEGVVIYHGAANQLFKVTLEGDEKPKGSKEVS